LRRGRGHRGQGLPGPLADPGRTGQGGTPAHRRRRCQPLSQRRDLRHAPGHAQATAQADRLNPVQRPAAAPTEASTDTVTDTTTPDTLQKFLFDAAPVRGELVRMEATWQEVLSRHSYPAPVRRLLGEMMAAAALLSANLKFNGALVMQLH